jgi:hypothetical protein
VENIRNTFIPWYKVLLEGVIYAYLYRVQVEDILIDNVEIIFFYLGTKTKQIGHKFIIQ